MFPTLLNLELLAESATVDEALAATATRTVVSVLPEVGKDADGNRVVMIPENAGYRTTRYPFQNKWVKPARGQDA